MKSTFQTISSSKLTQIQIERQREMPEPVRWNCHRLGLTIDFHYRQSGRSWDFDCVPLIEWNRKFTSENRQAATQVIMKLDET